MEHDSQESGPRHRKRLIGLDDLFANLTPFTVIAVFFGAIVFSDGISAFRSTGGTHNPHLPDPVSGVGLIALGTAIIVTMVGRRAWDLLELRQNRREKLDRLKADSIPERAKHAAQVLQEATTLVEELQAELTARAALLEDVRHQVAEMTERATDMEKISQVDAETTRILNKYFDEALKHRLEELEHGARGREWLIGTVVALVVGVGAILLSHYVLGF